LSGDEVVVRGDAAVVRGDAVLMAGERKDMGRCAHILGRGGWLSFIFERSGRFLG